MFTNAYSRFSFMPEAQMKAHYRKLYLNFNRIIHTENDGV